MSAVCAVGWTLFAVAALLALVLIVAIVANEGLEDRRRRRWMESEEL